MDYLIIKSTVLQYLKHVGCRRLEIIQLYVNDKLHGCYDSEVITALGELTEEGRLINFYDTVWFYRKKGTRHE